MKRSAAQNKVTFVANRVIVELRNPADQGGRNAAKPYHVTPHGFTACSVTLSYLWQRKRSACLLIGLPEAGTGLDQQRSGASGAGFLRQSQQSCVIDGFLWFSPQLRGRG